MYLLFFGTRLMPLEEKCSRKKIGEGGIKLKLNQNKQNGNFKDTCSV